MHSIVRVLAGCLLAFGLVQHAGAQTNWPEKPVKLVVGFTAGSATDVTARLFAQKFTEAWGQPVVVENIAGNSGAIGVDRVAKAVPDGYTLMWSGNAAITILPSMQALPFDPLKDLTPISTSLVMPSVFVVNNDLPVKSIAELIAYAKANPGKLSYGTPGVGTPQMSGVVPVGIQNAGAAMQLVRDGRVRGIAVTSLKRTASAPDLPTLAEQGFPGFEATSWFALMGPAGLPKPIVDKVRAESLKALADPELKKKIAAMGLDLVGSTPEETRAAIAADIPKWAKVIKDAGIKPGQ